MCHFIRNVVIMHESMKSKWNGARIKLLWVHIDIGLWIVLDEKWWNIDAWFSQEIYDTTVSSVNSFFSVTFTLIWILDTFKLYISYTTQRSTFVCLYYRIGDWFWVLSQGLSFQWQQTTHNFSVHIINGIIFFSTLISNTRLNCFRCTFIYIKHHT